MRIYDVFFVIWVNKLLNKQSSYWWYETPWSSSDVTLVLTWYRNYSHFRLCTRLELIRSRISSAVKRTSVRPPVEWYRIGNGPSFVDDETAHACVTGGHVMNSCDWFNFLHKFTHLTDRDRVTHIGFSKLHHHWLVQITARCLFGVKPLSKPVLAYC